jgi:hypothetical protein
MRLVPRQLRRAGMTGNVPYYGGRFTPTQAYAASHPAPPMPAGSAAAPNPPPTGTARTLGRTPLPVQHRSTEEMLQTLQQLLDAGLLTEAEHRDLRSRIAD